MKKTICILLVALTIFSLAACGKKADPAQDGQVFTGVLEEKKDFMVIVTADGGESYAFNLGDGVTCDAEEGDKVQVTYTGNLENFLDESLVATAVEKVK